LSNTLEILKRSSTTDAPVRHGLDTMERQLEQLVRLVDDLLDLSPSPTSHRSAQTPRRPRVGHPPGGAGGAAARRLRHHTIDVSAPAEPIYLHADPVPADAGVWQSSEQQLQVHAAGWSHSQSMFAVRWRYDRGW
jgi:hypothetical protein